MAKARKSRVGGRRAPSPLQLHCQDELPTSARLIITNSFSVPNPRAKSRGWTADHDLLDIESSNRIIACCMLRGAWCVVRDAYSVYFLRIAYLLYANM